jgi:hypothetical protein
MIRQSLLSELPEYGIKYGIFKYSIARLLDYLDDHGLNHNYENRWFKFWQFEAYSYLLYKPSGILLS